MAKMIVINRPNGTVTIVRKELETSSENPLTEHEMIINELHEQLIIQRVSQQRELLIDAYKFVCNSDERAEEVADEYIESKNN